VIGNRRARGAGNPDLAHARDPERVHIGYAGSLAFPDAAVSCIPALAPAAVNRYLKRGHS
jgi:hypothetical protein